MGHTNKFRKKEKRKKGRKKEWINERNKELWCFFMDNIKKYQEKNRKKKETNKQQTNKERIK